MKPDDDVLGKCVKCGMLQRLDRCQQQWATQIMVETDNSTILTVRAFGQMVTDIAQEVEITERALLTATPFCFTCSEGNIIQVVTRKLV